MTDRSVGKSSHQHLALLLFGIQDTFPTQKRKMFVFAVAYREVRKVSPSKPGSTSCHQLLVYSA